MQRPGARRRQLIIAPAMLLVTWLPALGSPVRPEVDNGTRGGGMVRVCLKLKEPTGAPAIHVAQRRPAVDDVQKQLLARLTGTRTRTLHTYERLCALALEADSAAIDRLRNDPQVEAVYLDGEIHTTLIEGRELIQAHLALQQGGYAGTGQTVALLDTGIDYSHPDLGGVCGANTFPTERVIAGYDFVNEDTDPRDDNGHGTAVAGIVAARGSKTGVSPGAQLVALKVMDSTGHGSFSDVDAALDWVIAHHAEYGISIVNVSLGDGLSHSDPLLSPCSGSNTATAIAALKALNIPVFIASGNDAFGGGLNYPACVPDAISVGSVYDASSPGLTWPVCWEDMGVPDMICCFTNRSPDLDLLAPSYQATTLSKNCGEESSFGGTSASAPYAAGAAALLLESDPGLTVDGLLARLRITGQPILDLRTDVVFPRINIWDAVRVSTGRGAIGFDKPDYCSGSAGITVLDRDLSGTGACNVTVTASSGDLETIALFESPAHSGQFRGTVPLVITAVSAPNDGGIQAIDRDVLTAAYQDLDDGSGQPAVAAAHASVDCARTATWASGNTGNWGDSAKWSTDPLFPDNGAGGENYNVQILGGTCTLDRNIEINRLTVKGTIALANYELGLHGPVIWYRNFIGPGLVRAYADVVFKGSTDSSLNNCRFENAATLCVRGSTLYGTTGTVLTNLPGATIDLQDGSFMCSGSTDIRPVLDNQGTLLKAIGTAAVGIDWQLNNVGNIQVHSGSLQLRAVISSGGNIEIAPGCGLTFVGTTMKHFDGTTFENQGRMLFTQACSTEFEGETTLGGVVELNDGLICGNGRVTMTGSMLWTSGSMVDAGTTVIAEGATLTVPANNSTHGLINHRVLENRGRADVGKISSLGSIGAVIRNLGQMNVAAETGQVSVPASLENAGELNLQSGTLKLAGGGLHNGRITVAPGAALEFTGGQHDISDLAIFPANGMVIYGATLAFAGDNALTNWTWKRGTINGAGTTRIPPDSTLTIGENVTGSSVTLAGRTIENAGTITLLGTSGNGMGLAKGAVIHNLPGALIELRERRVINQLLDPPARIENAGTIRQTSGGAATINVALTNTGTFDLRAGAATLTRGLTQTGGTTLISANGGTLTCNRFELQGGSLNGSGRISGTVVNSAIINIGEPAGWLAISAGSYTQNPTGELALEIGGPTLGSQCDQLGVNGTANLGGRLRLTLVNGYSPAAGTVIAPVSYYSRVGQFAEIVGPAAKRFSVVHDATQVRLIALAPAPADFDGDGDVDGKDVADLVGCASGPGIAVRAGCGPKDLDADGDVDQCDFGTLQRCYSGLDTAAEPSCGA